MDKIADNAKRARERMQMKPEAAAKAIGCSRTRVIGWEDGSNPLKGSKYLLAAARAYRVRPQWLAEGEGEDGYPWSDASASNDEAHNWPPILAYRVAASLGHGGPADEYAETHQLKFRAESLRRKRLKPEKLAVIYGRGDSMHPTIKDGDAILIDTADTAPKDGKLYVVVDGNDLLAKRLVEIDGQWFAMSDNPAYKPRRLDEVNGVRVAGRIRWVAGWVD